MPVDKRELWIWRYPALRLLPHVALPAPVLVKRAEFSGQATGPPVREIRVTTVARVLLERVRTAVAAIVKNYCPSSMSAPYAFYRFVAREVEAEAESKVKVLFQGHRITESLSTDIVKC